MGSVSSRHRGGEGIPPTSLYTNWGVTLRQQIHVLTGRGAFASRPRPDPEELSNIGARRADEIALALATYGHSLAAERATPEPEDGKTRDPGGAEAGREPVRRVRLGGFR
jgi:hypothetical protein